jgi:hypothetical protein
VFYSKPPLKSPLKTTIDDFSSNESIFETNQTDLQALKISSNLKSLKISTKRGSFSQTLDFSGPLVGSYEESILSGRMSSAPSKPITFVAEIGVVGMGNCKSYLKCPPHISFAFPACYYQLTDNEYPATPYVGTLDLDPANALGDSAVNMSSNGYRVPTMGQIQIVRQSHLGD